MSWEIGRGATSATTSLGVHHAVVKEGGVSAQVAIQQEDSIEGRSPDNLSNETVVTPFRQAKKQKKTRKKSKVEGKEAEKAKKEKKVAAVEKMNETVERYKHRFHNLNRYKIENILKRFELFENLSPKDVLGIIKSEYPDDVYLQGVVLSLLKDVVAGNTADSVKEAQKSLITTHGVEINAGEKILESAWNINVSDLSPEATTDKIFFNYLAAPPEDAATLLNKLFEEYSLDLDGIAKVLAFLDNATGRDLRSEGSEILPGRLYILNSETRKRQAANDIIRESSKRVETLIKQLIDIRAPGA